MLAISLEEIADIYTQEKTIDQITKTILYENVRRLD